VIDRSFALAALVAALSVHPSARAALPPTVTINEGKNTIVSGAAAHQPAPGVRLNSCDLLHTGPQALVQVETEDGTSIVIGPNSRFVFDVPSGGENVAGPHFLLAGWAKVTVPKREKAPPYRFDTPHFGLLSEAGVAVLRVAADEGEFFVENGSALAIAPGGARVPVAGGRTFARRAGTDRGAVTERARATFVKDMPQAFRDTLPSLFGNLKSRNVQPRPAPDYNAADVEGWLKAVPRLQGCVGNVTVREAQQALVSQGFELGPIDGIVGRRTQAALRAYQQKQGLTASGQLDAQTLRALDVVDRR
jgi:hypothetical protein